MSDIRPFSSGSHAPPTLLVIDDDPLQITLLNQIFKDTCQLHFEQDSLQALAVVESIAPDLILLDIEMPGLNGFEVHKLLKQHPQTRTIPVIFITVHSSPEFQVRCLNEGAVDFIIKPLNPKIVEARVRTQLKLKERETTLHNLYRHAAITLDSIGDAVISTDKDGRVRYMNPAAELITGHTNIEAQGRFIEDIMPLRIGHDGPAHVNPLRLAISEKRNVGMAFNCQLRNQRGKWISVEDSASPLISDSGDVIGGVIVFKDIDESRAMVLKMTHSLQHDQLTNLPNRFLLMEHLTAAIATNKGQQTKLGLLQLNIDRFKLINEEFGFAFGDSLLKKVANFLKQQLSGEETLSRHNADEFVILVPKLNDTSELANLALQLKEQLGLFSQTLSGIVNLTACIGLSLYPDDARDAQSLILHADSALKRAKENAIHQGICFYSDEMATQFMTRRKIYKHIKAAVSNQSVITLYQPMVNSQSGRVEAVEALMRISDDEGNIVPPIDFIAIAEDTRLILPLGEQMIVNSLKQQQKWQKAGRNIRICLNISPVQFREPGFVGFLTQTLQTMQIDPRMIELEVTESLMLETHAQLTRDIQTLRDMGITLSIDDFGTGYSSLSYLKDLPVDVLKIDKSFVALAETTEGDTVLIKTIAELANNMGLSSVAEGVETEQQVHYLQNLGISLLQGYYFSKPQPAEDVLFEYPL
ncbi:EAL domain-containing protein [Reinekea blandensis]|uniref:Uncharacterized protein n=1 Tax=Reinekea blandensis MED297 TaxID=314283 RepID=A4BB01_9GAMM|nr:EAL domain-containing protein [Reinekea blandensis]EAR10614.1 hypothetical protein MED297_11380 [Reinekea sp. MED297] [Reinekea blandensis MED297]